MAHRPALRPPRPPHPPPPPRPPPPPPAPAGPCALQHRLTRAHRPSALSNVRSVSDPADVIDLTTPTHAKNTPALAPAADGPATSPYVIIVDDDDGGGGDGDGNDRPSKRARTGGPDFRAGGAGSEAPPDAAHRARPGSPLPRLPPRKHVVAGRSTAPWSRRPAVEAAARRADGCEPPALAPRLPAPHHAADFHPWTGHHAEDVLTESVVRGGYYDKAPGPNTAETSSAKSTIWANLSAMNNMGLQTLSYLFTAVMEKRQAMGRVTGPSTFKPPPRVTVTDTKREAWLRDLANPAVPLRKQSRTIPHGVRGALLMEQCLGKHIPVPRAIWLAKCVGANELRAFRRKGFRGAAAANGEAKWVREWTVSVEQFVHGVLSACGQPGWQAKMDYAVKLAAGFYSETLLERDHYLDWIVASYAHASVPALPAWILLARLYWKDITAFGRRGRRLADATLAFLDRISRGEIHVNDTLHARLHKLVVILAATNRGCLILPNTWRKCGYLFAPPTAPPNTPAQNLARRNARLVAPFLKTSHNTRCALLRFYSLLDGLALHWDVGQISAACLALVPDILPLVAAVLDWSASVYRPGLGRIYVAAQIVSRLRNGGHDTDRAILGYLASPSTRSVDVARVHRVLVELVRRDCFSAGRYMQWLISSGVLSACDDGSSLATGLLPVLPPDALLPHLRNTRQMLMNRLKMSSGEDDAISAVEAAVWAGTDSAHPPIHQLSPYAKLELAGRLASRAATWAKEGSISLPCFCSVRDVLESVTDLQALATLLDGSISTDNAALLATVCDTVSMHGKAFAAIGCLQSLVDRITERYRMLRAQHALDRSFILALAVLVSRMPEQAPFLKHLDSDLAICDQLLNSLALCSPASDNLVSMRACNLDSDHEIDAVFASGNTMDEQLMQRLFSRIVQRASKAGTHLTSPGSTKTCAWLNQLRAVDASSFDAMARTYTTASLTSSGDNTAMLTVVCALVASGCVRFDVVAHVASEANTPAAASSTIRLLCSSTIINGGLGPAEAYRYRVHQKRYRLGSADKVIPLLITAMEDPSIAIDDEGFHTMVLEYAAYKYTECLQALREAPNSAAFLANCGRLVTQILSVGRGPGEAVTLDGKSIVALADPLSVVQCTGALAFLTQAGAHNDGELLPAILEAIANGCEVWPQLLDGASQQTVRGIYQWAKEQVFKTAASVDGPAPLSREELSRVLDVLDVTHRRVSNGEEGSGVVGAITEKLKALAPRLSGVSEAPMDQRQRAVFSLQVLLHLTVLFSPSTTSDRDVVGTHGRCQLLAAVCAILVHPGLQSHPELLEYVHDAASTLADTLPPDALANLRRSRFRHGISDPRLASIMGSTLSPPDSWLALVSPSPPPPPPPPPPASAPARSLLKHAPRPQPPTGRVAPRSPAHPPPSSPHHKPAPRPDARPPPDTKTTRFPLRRWEMIPDAAPTVGLNDTSLSLSLFGARRV